MYGYSFGAAKADVWHKYHTTAMIYPGYLPIGAPTHGRFGGHPISRVACNLWW
jgi:hypothetical protein